MLRVCIGRPSQERFVGVELLYLERKNPRIRIAQSVRRRAENADLERRAGEQFSFCCFGLDIASQKRNHLILVIQYPVPVRSVEQVYDVAGRLQKKSVPEFGSWLPMQDFSA